MLAVEDLVCEYGPVRAVDGVSLTVPTGSVTAVLGANGAGKTSLLRAISGLARTRTGTVRLAGDDITRLHVEEIVRRGLSHVPEGRGVIAELTVEENLRLGGLWRRRTDTAPLSEIYDLFPRLAERRQQPATTLSGGERQMLSLGRALVARPRVLLLDEPSLGLAPLLVAQLMGVIRRLADGGLAVLLVEQNARSALSIADAGVVLNLGRVVATQAPEQLASDDRLLHAYLGF